MADEEFVWALKAEGHLITRKAGGSAREQAKRLRDAEPVRTRVARLLKVHTDERAYRIGADGEVTVGARLAKLDASRWLTLHDIVLNDSGTNLDHLVIGPAGVFSLNTKHHPKKDVVVTARGMRVNGHRTGYLPIAVSEAKKVSRILEAAVGFPVPVQPVIVVVGAELEVRAVPEDVSVVDHRKLVKWLGAQPHVLDDSKARGLMRVAGRPSTWRPPKLTVRAWSRYGKKRLYVNDGDGKTLGYRDELTGEVHAHEACDLQRVTQALRMD